MRNRTIRNGQMKTDGPGFADFFSAASILDRRSERDDLIGAGLDSSRSLTDMTLSADFSIVYEGYIGIQVSLESSVYIGIDGSK